MREEKKSDTATINKNKEKKRGLDYFFITATHVVTPRCQRASVTAGKKAVLTRVMRKKRSESLFYHCYTSRNASLSKGERHRCQESGIDKSDEKTKRKECVVCITATRAVTPRCQEGERHRCQEGGIDKSDSALHPFCLKINKFFDDN